MPSLPDRPVPPGLWQFKDISVDPHNRMCLRIRFSQRVEAVHKAQMLDAIIGWMKMQQMIMEHGGKLNPQDAIKLLQQAGEQPKEITNEHEINLGQPGVGGAA